MAEKCVEVLSLSYLSRNPWGKFLMRKEDGEFAFWAGTWCITENHQEINFSPNRQTVVSHWGGSLNFPCLTVFPAGPSRCEAERSAALRFQHPFVPSCTSSGGYEPQQCHQGGQCWCVDTQGQEIPGTRRRGQPPACGRCICQRKNEPSSLCL